MHGHISTVCHIDSFHEQRKPGQCWGPRTLLYSSSRDVTHTGLSLRTHTNPNTAHTIDVFERLPGISVQRTAHGKPWPYADRHTPREEPSRHFVTAADHEQLLRQATTGFLRGQTWLYTRRVSRASFFSPRRRGSGCTALFSHAHAHAGYAI